jgi:hypothetical protein
VARRTLAQLRSTVLRRVGNSPQITAAIATAILADVHKDIATSYQWSQRRREVHVQTAGSDSTGTVALVNGSATVTGTGTAWTAAMVGRAIAVAPETNYFYVASVNVGAQTLTLGDAQGATLTWGGATVSGVTFRIFKAQYALNATVAIVLRNTRDFTLDEKTVADFDAKDPLRQSTGPPSEYALARSLISGTPPVETSYLELWPVPDSVYEYRVPCLIEPPELSADADLPVCPPEPIEWRASAEAAWYIFTKTGDARWDTLGKSYYQVYAGREDDGVPGVLLQALRDDQARFGLPQVLGGRDTIVGYDRLATRDWEAVS